MKQKPPFDRLRTNISIYDIHIYYIYIYNIFIHITYRLCYVMSQFCFEHKQTKNINVIFFQVEIKDHKIEILHDKPGWVLISKEAGGSRWGGSSNITTSYDWLSTGLPQLIAATRVRVKLSQTPVQWREEKESKAQQSNLGHEICCIANCVCLCAEPDCWLLSVLVWSVRKGQQWCDCHRSSMLRQMYSSKKFKIVFHEEF